MALGVVAAPATAGKTHKLVGAFDQQPGSRVSMQVKLNDKGKPKFVKNFKFSGMAVTCDLPEPDPDATRSGEVPGKIRVKAGTNPPRYKKQTSEQSPTGEVSVDISVSGELRKKGKLSTGEVSFSGQAGGIPCVGGPDTFEASKE
jgi:hypothetical protein